MGTHIIQVGKERAFAGSTWAPARRPRVERERRPAAATVAAGALRVGVSGEGEGVDGIALRRPSVIRRFVTVRRDSAVPWR